MAEVVTIRIPTPLRSYTDGADQVVVQAATVAEALAALGEIHPGILERVLGADGELRQFVNLYLGPDNVRVLYGLATPLTAGAVLAIVPAVAGGTTGKGRRLAELRAAIPEVSPAEALKPQAAGAVLVSPGPGSGLPCRRAAAPRLLFGQRGYFLRHVRCRAGHSGDPRGAGLRQCRAP